MKVFISYQHADTLYAAHALFRALKGAMHDVFLDEVGIEPGGRFWSIIRNEITTSDLLLVLIGENFDVDRLREPGNFVSKEWRFARFTGCPVHMVLVDREHALGPAELPAELRWLTGTHAHRLRRESASGDLDRITAEVTGLTSRRGRGLARALWVDDNPANNEREREMLRDLGIVIDNVVSTKEARAQLQMSNYDLIITDLGRFRGTDYSSEAGLDLLETPEVVELGPPLIIYTSPRYRNRFPELVSQGAYGATAERRKLKQIVLQALGREEESA